MLRPSRSVSLERTTVFDQMSEETSMTTTLAGPDRRSALAAPTSVAGRRPVTVFSVDVVDGNGLEVAGEAVTASYRFPDGSRSTTVAATDGGGRARFADEHAADPVSVTISAGRESITDIRPRPGSALVIET
jgi:hypothetical protein